MWKSLVLASAACFAAVAFCAPAHAQTVGPEIVTQRFVHSVLDEDYATSWSLLTQKSKTYIVDSVSRDEKLDPTLVSDLFEKNDPRVVSGFWTSFRNSSKTVMTQLASRDAAVVATDGDSARVQFPGFDKQWLCFREAGVWRLGFAETFFL